MNPAARLPPPEVAAQLAPVATPSAQAADTPKRDKVADGAFSFTGDAWGHAGRAASRDRSDLRSSHGRHRNAALGPVLSTEATWSRHGPTLAEKRQALANLIERRNAGNKSHHLLSRIYSARTEIIAMEIALA